MSIPVEHQWHRDDAKSKGDEALVEPYLAWWRGREAAGWRWWQGEQDKRTEPAALGGLALKGRLDRLDRDDGGRIDLLDYKTVAVDKLKRTVADRFEDTQLAFYAALVLGAPGAPPPGRTGRRVPGAG